MKKELALIASLAAGCGGQPRTLAKPRLVLRSEVVAVLAAGPVYDRGPVFDKSWCRTDCPCDPPPAPATIDC